MNLVNGLVALPSVSLYHYTVLSHHCWSKQYVGRVSHMNLVNDLVALPSVPLYHYRSFSLSRNKKINWKPSSGRSQTKKQNKQFFQGSGLCGWQFMSYLPKRFTLLCRALYGDAMLVHQYSQYGFGAPIWPPEINKNTWSSLFLEKLFLFTRELAYLHINISSNTWNGYAAENQEEIRFFNETAFQFWCHALWKLGSSNFCIFEMKHFATGLESCTKIYFFVYLQPSVNKNS